ncbi:FtsX-like permease family protein [Gluconacetobacter tumulisoli]|uniref:ABC transporter permease n=1 Tax=Gluconacetobacter tumulisoli TaxID=1286189 RepID=A0A7W4K4V2_9PROT|nr:FtsX-like permease family protein [Gluconacetobacter tumulisoli]MBB2200298.1 ABC transporter permease [Gluconacetobacter tumulisoli]
MADRTTPGRPGASWSQARRADGLALRRAIPDRLLPVLVAAMAVLAAMALAGATGARILSARWTTGAASIVTVQVPRPDDPALVPASRPATPAGADAGTAPPALSRADAVLAALADVPGASRVHRLDKAELETLLSPWLGHDGDFALALPAVIELHLDRAGAMDADALAARLDARAPDTLVERNSLWSDRLGDLARSLQTCAILAVLIVVAVAAATIAATTRAGLGARRQAIELIHSLGATDGYIAGRFAGRTAVLAFTGGLIGSLLALPLLVLLSRLAAPFAGATAPAATVATTPGPSGWGRLLAALPLPLAVTLLSLAPAAALIGWLTTQITVRTWLRRLP